ncbi:MAG TPA: hypothetical protein VFN35_19055, partial [Ktedonobacteraceae bacterium]|nr:hypothetical protein [Ktedonobacteraceae bacterium]
MHQRSQRPPGTAQAQPVQQRRLASAQRPELLRKLEAGEGDLSGPSRLTFSLANIPLFPPTPAEVSPEEGTSSQT